VNECKKEVRADVEIPVGLRCRIAILRNFGRVIPLIQMPFLGKKNPIHWNPLSNLNPKSP
jgi:hypothetical protein